MPHAAAGLNSSDSKEAKEVFTKVLSRMALFGALPPSILPALVSVRTKVDLPKTADRKLLRIVNYLIQLAAGEGSAGTVVPFSTLLGEQQGAAHSRMLSTAATHTSPCAVEVLMPQVS